MPLDDNEAWLHPIKAISVKRDKPGVPRPEGAYDSSHKPSEEDELHDYQLPPLPHPTSGTPCSPLLSALMLSGMRLRSTESSSHRIWRRFALICIRCWPTRPLFFSSNSPSMPSLLSSWHSTSRHRHRRNDPSITKGVLFILYCSFVASGDIGYFCLGGGVSSDRVFVGLVLFFFDFRISTVVYFYLCMLVYISA